VVSNYLLLELSRKAKNKINFKIINHLLNPDHRDEPINSVISRAENLGILHSAEMVLSDFPGLICYRLDLICIRIVTRPAFNYLYIPLFRSSDRLCVSTAKEPKCKVGSSWVSHAFTHLVQDR
jgi:hypothetical protein